MLCLAIAVSHILASELIRLDGPVSPDGHPFSILTKNVLANEWIRPEYYPYAGPEIRSWNHRFPSNMAEVRALDADILTLQEVDRLNTALTNEFYLDGQPSRGLEGHWEPGLQALGYEMIFAEQNPKHVGVLLGHKAERWIEINSGSIRMTEATEHLTNVNANAATWKALQERKKSDRGVIVFTTHLYFASAAVRSHQVILLLKEIQAVRNQYPDYPVLWSGDFNMRPEDCARKIIVRSPEILEEGFWEDVQKPSALMRNDRGANPEFSWEEAKNEIISGSLSELEFHDIFGDCGFATTHRTGTFDAVLDYVFSLSAVNGQNVKMLAYKPLPAGEEIDPMPNIQNPSDHFALYAVLAFE